MFDAVLMANDVRLDSALHILAALFNVLLFCISIAVNVFVLNRTCDIVLTLRTVTVAGEPALIATSDAAPAA